jgi:hypothetical protein
MSRSNLQKILREHQKVRILSCPQDRSTLYFQLSWPLSWLLWVFRISGQFLWPSVAPMLARCMASCGACISRREPKIESFFESSESANHWGFAWLGLVLIRARRGGRIRTIISISMHFITLRELPSHTRSPSRRCLHLVLVPLKWSFGILMS